MSEVLTQEDIELIDQYLNEFGSIPFDMGVHLLKTARLALKLEADNARLWAALDEALEPVDDETKAEFMARHGLAEDGE